MAPVTPLSLSKLVLSFPLSSTSSDTIIVTNTSLEPAAFNIKTTNPERYVVRPSIGVLSAGTSVDISVTLHGAVGPALDADLAPGPTKDNVLVHAAQASGLDPAAPPEAFWAGATAPAATVSTKLRVVLVEAAAGGEPPAEALATRVPAAGALATKLCAACGKEATLFCTSCTSIASRKVRYCDRACQKADWQMHKKVCFSQGSKCTRCLEAITSSNLKHCNVPHPTHLCHDAGAEKSATEITVGPKCCYSGPHTVKPVEDDDERRVREDSLVLTAGPDLQKEIDSIPKTNPNLSILVIESVGWYDDSFPAKLHIAMPELRTLKIIDVAFDRITLNTELTPKIEELEMRNIHFDCRISILLPELKSLTIRYYGPSDDEEWVHKMLATAKKLVTFDSYKLLVGLSITFASNDLVSIRLHRAELLQFLTIYAPRLSDLSLRACFQGYIRDGELNILETYPGFTDPRCRPAHIKVDTTDAGICPSMAHYLDTHPRTSRYEQTY